MAKKKKEPSTNEQYPVIGRYINPFTDFGFKKIFGEEPNKDILIDFLNELLREQNHEISDLTYKKTDRLGATDIDRNVVFDLYCENTLGEKFIVEMQKAKQTYFKDRTVFYSTFPIQEQAPKGPWDFKLKSVFAIAILDFVFDDHDKNKIVVSRVQLVDHTTEKVFYDKLTYIFIQMPNFTKTFDELETHLDKWFYVLKNLDKFERIPDKIKDKIFRKIFQIAEYQKLSKEERAAYENSIKYYRDLKNSLDTAEQDGYQKAEEKLIPLLAEAKAREEEERRQKEEAKAREEEERRQKEEAKAREEEAKAKERETTKKLAYRMKKYGEPIEHIIAETGLSVKEINEL